MRRTGPSRRAVLRGGAGAAIALPLLEAMNDGARAQALPRRLIVFITTNGTFPERYWPLPPGTAALPAGAKPAITYRTGPTALDTRDHVFSPIVKPLEKHRKDLLFVEGIDNYDAKIGHDGLNFLLRQWPLRGKASEGMGSSAGVSVDQLVARQIGKDSKIPALQLGVITSGSQYYSFHSWVSLQGAAPPQNDPVRVYERLFADLAMNPAALEQIRSERRSVLDVALAQTMDLKPRVSAGDWLKLQNYFESVRSLETRLAAGGGGVQGCGKPQPPAAGDVRAAARMPALLDAQLDLMAMAVACDLTRVITIQIGDEGSNFTHPHLGINQGFHFDLVHGGKYEEVAKINTWYAEQVAALIDRLKAIPEGGKTAFDNTLILWTVPMARGNPHVNPSVPVMLAGGSGGYFQMGRFVRYAQSDTRTLADLYVSVLRSFGIPAKDFGHLAVNHAAVDNLRG